jgi:hypothetical protein
MTGHEFDTWRKRAASLGQQRLADTIRKLIYREDEALFELLDFTSDAQFLDPTLFAYFTDPSPPVTLPQVLYGVTPADRRPDSVLIKTDAAGRVLLGSVGTIETDLPCATLQFGRNGKDSPYRCLSGQQPVPFHARPPLMVPGTRIEVTGDIHPLFRRFYDASPPAPEIAGVRPARDNLHHLFVALDLIRTHCPLAWKEIASFTRIIVLYRAAAPNSFAALSAHGAIFCNRRPGEDEIGLLEDVAHQAAHVIFNAVTHDASRFLLADRETLIHAFSGELGETRSLYEAFHGLFTYTLICRVLLGVYNAATLPERQSHEILARLGFTLRKFAYDLEHLDLPAVYTAAGRRCYDAFAAEYDSSLAQHGDLLADFTYDNQPYAFDYACFVERNGGPWPIARELARELA